MKYNYSKLKLNPWCRRLYSGLLPLLISGLSANVDMSPWKLLEMFSYANVGLSAYMCSNRMLLMVILCVTAWFYG